MVVGLVPSGGKTHEGAEELPPVSDDHTVRNGSGKLLLDDAFDQQRRDVLATGCNDELLQTPREVDEAVLVHGAQISRVEKTILVQRPPGRLLVFVVAHEDISAAKTNLALAFLILIRQHHICPRKCMPNTPHFEPVQGGACARRLTTEEAPSKQARKKERNGQNEVRIRQVFTPTQPSSPSCSSSFLSAGHACSVDGPVGLGGV